MTEFSFSLVRLNQASTCLGGIRAPSFVRRPAYRRGEDDGTIHATSQHANRVAPMARFQTVAARALNALLVGSSELPMVALDGTNGLELIGGQIATAVPGYLGTTSHARRQAISGHVYLAGLDWSPGDVLVSTAEAFAIAANGTTDPFPATIVALPTVPVNTEQLVLSSLTLGGLAITRCASYSVQVTHQAENNDDGICFNLGLPFPVMLKTAGVGGTSEVVITIECDDLTGTPTVAGACTAVFTALAVNGVGLGTAIMTVTGNNCLIQEEEIQGRPGRRRFTARATWDGTTRPLTCVNG